MSTISWPSNCDTSVTAFVKAGCDHEQVLNIPKAEVGYAVVTFDVVCMFFLWIAFQIHGTYEDLEEKEIDGVVLDGADFTVEVENIPLHYDIRILKAQIWRHIETVLKDHPEYAVAVKNDPNAFKIAQCNFALTKYLIMYYYKKRLTYEKRDRILALREAVLEKSKISKDAKQKEREKFAHKREQIRKSYEENEEVIKEMRNKKDIRAVKVYITMQSMEGKQRIKKAFMAKKIRRCCNRKKYLQRYIKGKWLTVRDAPKSSIILWENLAVSKLARFLRICLVSLLSASLILITFGIMILSKSYQRNLSQSYNASTCPGNTVTKSEAYQDILLPENDRTGLMH